MSDVSPFYLEVISFRHNTVAIVCCLVLFFYICDPGPKKNSLKSLGYNCSNSQEYIVWVKIIIFYFMPKYN